MKNPAYFLAPQQFVCSFIELRMNDKSVSCVVLAAGKGTRMKSSRTKVLHEVFFAPMIHHVLDAVAGLPLAKTVVVVGHQQAAVGVAA